LKTTTTSYTTPPDLEALPEAPPEAEAITTTTILEELTFINDTPTTTTFTQAPTLGAIAAPVAIPNHSISNLSNASNYVNQDFVTVASNPLNQAQLNYTNDFSGIIIVILFCLFVCLLILYACMPRRKKKRRRSVVPEPQFHRIDIDKDDPEAEMRQHIVKKWLDELIKKVDRPPPVMQAAEQLVQLRKAKRRLLRNRKEKQHKQLRHLVLKNMRNNKMNAVRNPMHQPLKKQMRIKEIFNEAVKLDVQGRPKSPFKEV
jgi:hypothetical protein